MFKVGSFNNPVLNVDCKTKAVLFPKKELMEKIVEVFARCIQEKRPLTTMIRPKDGVSGFTFLCSTPWRNLKHLKISETFSRDGFFHFILKWVVKGEADSEKQCAKWYRSCNISAPTIRILSLEISKKIHKIAMKSCSAMSQPDSYQLLVMNRFQSMTLKSFIQEGHIEDLSEVNLFQLFKEIGKGAFCDLITCNNDRVITFDFEKENFLNFDTPSLNEANIMVETAILQTALERIIQKIHFIDNTPKAISFNPTTRNYLTEDNFTPSLFNESSEDSGGEDKSAPQPTPPLGEIVLNRSENVTPPVKDSEDVIRESTCFLRANQYLQINLDILAEHIGISFIQRHSEIAKNKVLIIKAILEGLLETSQFIKTNKIAFYNLKQYDNSFNKAQKIVQLNLDALNNGENTSDC